MEVPFVPSVACEQPQAAEYSTGEHMSQESKQADPLLVNSTRAAEILGVSQTVFYRDTRARLAKFNVFPVYAGKVPMWRVKSLEFLCEAAEGK
jgi:hypothetical protein